MDKNDLNEIRAEDVTVITSACVEGANPPCARACPFTLDVRAFVGRAEKGKWQTAFKSYRDAVVFPELVSRLCPAPCEGVCTRESVGGAIDLGGLERATVGFAKNKRRESYVIPQKDKKIAIVGAGAAGLSAALSLSLKKYRVTVFERAGAWGGALRGHADFAIFDAEWRESFSTLDAELRFNAEIADLDALAGFDAAYIATGDGGESFGLLAGFDSELLSTARAGAFLGGGLIGADLMTGVAQGRRASQSIETYLQTGKPSRPPSQDCDWSPDASEFAHSPRVAATDGGFTEEQAQAEAARCLKCDCDKCMQGCEMLRRFHKMPIKIANEVYTDMRANPPFAAHTLTREAYSCNNCGYCKRECPKSIDAGELLRLSRRARVAAESAPPALHDYWLREMDFSTGEAALIAAPPGKTTCEYVFFPGCQLGAYRPEHVLRPLEALREQLDVGVFLGCCGAPAYWAGDDDRLDANTAQIRAAWERLGQPTFVFACATCARVFSEILPEIDGVSLYEKLADADKLAPAAIFDSAAVFDPCASGDDEDMQNAVRALATRSGVALTELAERGKCCGHGGHIRLANPSLYEEITANRAGESELPYIVYCANCREVFASRGKACAHILDVAFGLSAPATPDIDARRKNSIEVKRMVTKQFAGGDFSPTANPWDDIELIIDAETAERIDRKLIAQSDIREAIYLAQRDGDRFTAPDGSEQCSMIKAALVYWVMYRRLGDSRYEITDAYYHRMKFGEESDNG